MGSAWKYRDSFSKAFLVDGGLTLSFDIAVVGSGSFIGPIEEEL